ncbi:hypothetical protein DFS34DRAFT_1464 [Phlyctochytrium arcticum]|nr:hypothetical protein DFS34DRAFT_1464 [Phlyctochytrium arcticum]
MSTAQRIYCPLLRCIQRPRCSSIPFTGISKASDRSFLTKAERTAFILTGKALPRSARPSKAPRTNKEGPRRLEEEGEQAPSRHAKDVLSIRRVQSSDSEVRSNNPSGKQADAHRSSPENSSTKREIWYSDPFHLREKVEQLLKDEKVEVAEDLVRRHTGAAGTEVYGALISGLGRQGKHRNALQAFKEMKGRRLKPSPQVHTSLLSSIGRAAFGTSDDLAKKNRLQEASDLWETIDSKELPHLNAMLNVCASCVSVGGWERGWDIYRQSYSGSATDALRQDEKLPKPDIVTFTTMLRLCAEKKGDEGLDAAFGIWENLQHPVARRAKKPSAPTKKPAPPHVDSRLVSMFLLACIRGATQSKIGGALPIVSQWLGLPITHDDASKPKPKSKHSRTSKKYSRTVNLNTPIVYHLMRLASRLDDPVLAMAWYRIAVDQDVELDDAISNVLVELLVSKGSLEDAWVVAMNAPPDISAQIKKRVCAIALRKGGPGGSTWESRSKTC